MKKRLLGMATSLVALLALAETGAFAQAPAGLRVEVLSSRQDLVSGGDALVKITGGEGSPAVTVGGKDVSGAFKADPKGGWVGLEGHYD